MPHGRGTRGNYLLNYIHYTVVLNGQESVKTYVHATMGVAGVGRLPAGEPRIAGEAMNTRNWASTVILRRRTMKVIAKLDLGEYRRGLLLRPVLRTDRSEENEGCR